MSDQPEPSMVIYGIDKQRRGAAIDADHMGGPGVFADGAFEVLSDLVGVQSQASVL